MVVLVAQDHQDLVAKPVLQDLADLLDQADKMVLLVLVVHRVNPEQLDQAGLLVVRVKVEQQGVLDLPDRVDPPDKLEVQVLLDRVGLLDKQEVLDLRVHQEHLQVQQHMLLKPGIR